MTIVTLPPTNADVIRLAGIRRPITWDDMGSSARDIWEERQIRSIRKQIPCDVWLHKFDSAESAWWFLYHARITQETDWERKEGRCSSCGAELKVDEDHDSDTEEALELGRMARRNITGIVVAEVVGTAIPMAFVVSEHDGRFSASFGPW